MNRRGEPDDLRDSFPLRPPLLALLIYGYLVYFLQLSSMLPLAPLGRPGFASMLLPTMTWLHSSFALLLLVDAVATLTVARRSPGRVAVETALALGILWLLQSSVELMRLAGL